MRMLNPEFERAAEAAVPLSQSGYAKGRGTTEQVLVARLALEQQRMEQKMLCLGFMDCGTFFMSCVKTVQVECEAWMGVDPGVTRIVQALHAGVTAQYETAHGLTETFDMDTGNGQGCVNGAVRSKLQLAVVQRAIEQICDGYNFTGYGEVKQLIYADDALYMAESIADLQLMFDTCWIMMTMMGLQVMIKGKKKTAFMATYWKDGKQIDVDMGALEMRLPDGRVVPQIHMEADATRDAQHVQRRQAHGRHGQRAPMRGRQGTADAVVSGGASGETRTYRYLGCEISPSPDTGYERTRAEVVRQTAQILQIIGRLPGLDNARMCEVMGVAVQGILGFFGRTTPMTWADCEAIEAARAGALRARGFSPGNPRVQIYAATEQGGLGHPHAYRVAAGALIAQIDRALSGDDGEPQREAARCPP